MCTPLGFQFGLGYVCALILSLSVFGLGCELDLEFNSGWVMFVPFGLGCEYDLDLNSGWVMFMP